MSKIRFVDPGIIVTSGGENGGDSSISSSYALSASYASTASFLEGTITSASYAVSASYAEYAVSASHEITKEVSSSYADTASLALSGNGPFTGSFTGSFFGNGSGVFSGSFSGSIPDAYQIISGSVSASISPDKGLQINSPVDITMPSGSVFTIHEPDIDQQNRLDFRFDQGNPMLEIASRSTTSSLYLRTNQTENGLLFDSSGKIKYIVSGTTYAVKFTTAGFVPNAPAQLNLGEYNRRWKDLYVNNGNKISFGVSDNSDIDLVSFRHTVGTNTLVMSGSSDVSLDVKGVVSASRFTVSASADTAPGYTFWNNSTTGMLSNSPTNLKFQIDGTSSPELEMTTGQATFRVPVSLTDNEISNVSRIRNLGSITGSGDNLPIQGSIEVTNITASNNISASNNLFTKQLYVENNLAIDYDFSHNCISFGNVSDCLNLLGTSITASSNLSSSATSTASFGTYLGDGSQLSGISSTPFPFTGDAQITGSLEISGSGNITSSGYMLITSSNTGGGNNSLMTPGLVINQVGSSQNHSGPAIRLVNSTNGEETNIYHQPGGSGASHGNALNILTDGGINIEAGDDIGSGGAFFRLAKGQALFTIDDNSSAPRTDVKIYNGNGGTAYSRLSLGAQNEYWYIEADDNNTPFNIGFDNGSTDTDVITFTKHDGSLTGSLEIVGGPLKVTGSLISSGSVVNFTGATAISGSTFSGSFVGNGSGLTNLPASSPFPFTGSAIVSGSLEVTGSFSVTSDAGHMFQINNDGTFTLGDGAVVASSNATAIGTNANANGNATAYGNYANASGGGANAFGSFSSATGTYSVAIGYDADVTVGNSIALGSYTNNTGANSILMQTVGNSNITNSDPRVFKVHMSNYTVADFQLGSFNTDSILRSNVEINNPSASAATSSLAVHGSGSTVFDVIGSQGTLFSVDDDLSGTIFTANDISGLPILEASASGDVYIGKSPQSLYTTAVISSTTAATTQSIFGLSTSSYDGAFFDYTVQSGSDARAGSIMAVWNGGNISFTETTTTDIGNTTDFNLIVHISQSQAQIASHATNAGYKIKTIIRSI